jgi:hypothetical protein
MSYNFGVKDLKNVAYRANNLGLFSIKGDNSITADALSTISQQFPLLEKIEFGVSVYGLCVCNDFDRSVRVLANGCPKLKYFVFRFTQKQNVTDIGVAHLFRSCRNLKYFELYAFSEITDNFLFELSVHCPFLKHLSLAHSEFITAKGIISILACCRRLRKLKLVWCTNIQDIDNDANHIIGHVKYAFTLIRTRYD